MKKRYKIIAVLLCFVLTFSFVMVKPDESHAFAGAALAELALGVSMAAGGLSITSQQYINAIFPLLNQNQKSYIEENVSSWQENNEIVIDNEMFQSLQVVSQGLMTNETAFNISQGKILNIAVPDGPNILYFAPGITLNESLATKYVMSFLGDYSINDKFYLKRGTYSGSGHFIYTYRYIEFDDDPNQNRWISKQHSSDSHYGFESSEIVTYSFFYFGSEPYNKRLNVKLEGIRLGGNYYYTFMDLYRNDFKYSVFLMDYIDSYVQEYQDSLPAPLAYNAYAPPLDDDGNVRIPWPAGLDWEKLLNKSGEDIWNLPGTGEVPGETPGETGKDYTGILGAILAAVGSVSGALSDVLTSIRDFSKINDFDLDFEPLKVNFTDRFPFCIPFDFIRLISVFSSSPSDFTFNIKLETAYFNINHTVDLSPFQVPILFFRYVVVFWFVYILISRTRDFIKW